MLLPTNVNHATELINALHLLYRVFCDSPTLRWTKDIVARLYTALILYTAQILYTHCVQIIHSVCIYHMIVLVWLWKGDTCPCYGLLCIALHCIASRRFVLLCFWKRETCDMLQYALHWCWYCFAMLLEGGNMSHVTVWKNVSHVTDCCSLVFALPCFAFGRGRHVTVLFASHCVSLICIALLMEGENVSHVTVCFACGR